MTTTELTDRLREAIVLNGPDAWRTNGYLADAQAAGLSVADAEALAAEVSDEVSANSILFKGIRDRIARLALPSRSAYRDQDTSRIILAAQSLKLSPDFVRDRWIPAELAKFTPLPTPPDPEPVIAESPVPAPVAADVYEELLEPEPLPPIPVQPEPAKPAGETVESMRRKVYDSLNDYGDRIPAPAIRSLFRTISYDEAELAVAIWSYLQIEGYQPITESVSSDLREKLTATDWQIPIRQAASPPPVYVPPIDLPEPTAPIVHSFTATPARVMRGKPVTLEWDVENLLAVTIDDLGEGLSPKNRGWIKPKKTADYTLFDVNNNPLSTVRVEVIPPDRSGLYGVLFALFLLALIYYFVRGSASGNNADTEETNRREQTEDRPAPTKKNTSLSYSGPESAPDKSIADPTPEAVETAATDTKIAESAVAQPEDVKPKEPEPESVAAPAPVTPQEARRGKYEEAFGDKPYDKVELGDDELGWRRARKNGRWGYIDTNDKWVIEPEYGAVTPFKGNTASVFLNGQLITIDRDGRQIRN